MRLHGDLRELRAGHAGLRHERPRQEDHDRRGGADQDRIDEDAERLDEALRAGMMGIGRGNSGDIGSRAHARLVGTERSEEHTSELQSLMRTSYAVFCLKKKKQTLTKQSN